MLNKLLEKDLKTAVKKLGFNIPTDPLLYIPENSKFGEYSSNIPLQLSKQKSKKSYHSPREIAKDIIEKMGHPPYLEMIEIAGPGFINFFFKDQALAATLLSPQLITEKKLQGQNILLEYAQPNTHKPFHIGHVRNITIGESLARLLEVEGANVFRVTYGGDIGPHVAKALWGIKELNKEYEEVKNKSLSQKANFLGKAYAFGATKYEEEEKVKSEIDQINQKLYKKDAEVLDLWKETSQWSQGYLDTIYSRLGTEFDAQIWESEIYETGALVVQQNIGKVFKEDQGAVIFPGEKYGLHTRVFLTSKGFPTYEGKEIGLSRKEQELFPFDQAIYLVGNEQDEYFKVVTKAIELIDTEVKGKKSHLPFGMVNLSSGKMSSRKGNVITAEELIEEVSQKIKESYPQSEAIQNPQTLEQITISAIKFHMLKFSSSSNINYDIKKSVSLNGDTGPYLNYTYARTQSVLSQSDKDLAKSLEEATLEFSGDGLNLNLPKLPEIKDLEPEEKQVLTQLEYFDYYIEKYLLTKQPNELSLYLIQLAKSFNHFYQKLPIIKSKNAKFRVSLTWKVGLTLKEGLYLLGIETPSRM